MPSRLLRFLGRVATTAISLSLALLAWAAFAHSRHSALNRPVGI